MKWLIKKTFWCKLDWFKKNFAFSIWNWALSWTVNRPLRAKEVVITHHKASLCIMMQVTRNGVVFKIKDETCSDKCMHWKRQWFLLLFFFRNTGKEKEDWKILENVNLGRNKPTQTSKAEVREETALNSPFRLRTSEIPLYAAFHLFYPSSLIRLGWPCDPRARVTCQLTVHSRAWGLMLCQHLS